MQFYCFDMTSKDRQKASDLSDFSHHLDCWRSSSDGQFIDYTASSGEVNRALCERYLDLIYHCLMRNFCSKGFRMS